LPLSVFSRVEFKELSPDRGTRAGHSATNGLPRSKGNPMPRKITDAAGMMLVAVLPDWQGGLIFRLRHGGFRPNWRS